jgi:hypothetical protein
MSEYIVKIKDWIANNKAVAIVIGVVVAFLAWKKLGKKTYRRKKRYMKPTITRRRVSRSARVNKPAARRVSVNRIIKSGKNRGKKAWQIKGSPEARRHMALIRRKRSK